MVSSSLFKKEEYVMMLVILELGLGWLGSISIRDWNYRESMA
jgi:hypothetical protein